MLSIFKLGWHNMGHIYLRMAVLWPVSPERALLLFIGSVLRSVRLKRFCASQNNHVQLGSVFARRYRCGCLLFSWSHGHSCGLFAFPLLQWPVVHRANLVSKSAIRCWCLTSVHLAGARSWLLFGPCCDSIAGGLSLPPSFGGYFIGVLWTLDEFWA